LEVDGQVREQRARAPDQVGTWPAGRQLRQGGELGQLTSD